MMRVGVGGWKRYSRQGGQSSASAWFSSTRLGKPSSSLQTVPRQWPRVATFFRAKARQTFCPYFPSPLKGWKPLDLVFPHLMCRPGLYPPPSWFCTCENLHVTFTWHGEPAAGVTLCHSPVRSSRLLSECLCLSREDVLDVCSGSTLETNLILVLLPFFFFPQRNWEIKRRGRIRKSRSDEPLKEEKSLFIWQEVTASLIKGQTDNLVLYVVFSCTPVPSGKTSGAEGGGAYFRDSLAHLSSVLSCTDRLTKLESLANFLGVNRLFGSPLTYIFGKQEFSEMGLLPAGCIRSCLPLGWLYTSENSRFCKVL